jgi:MOSC domain-containing protein
MALQLTEIWRYPVKSCRGERLAEAVVEPWGLAGDRRWMVVDADGRTVTAREHPRLVLVTPRVHGGRITLTSPDLPDLTVPVPAGPELVTVRVWEKAWENQLAAAPAADKAAAWLSDIIGEPVRLVYLADPTQRATNPAYSRDGDRVSLADGYPLLLTSEESLGAVNAWIAEGTKAAEGPVPMRRFRPNVVVSGAPAWAEDGWRRLRIGPVTFRNAKGCDRCVFTTIDPDTAQPGHEPLFALARHRRWDGKIWFGVNLIPDLPGLPGQPAADAVIRPGDPVEILD